MSKCQLTKLEKFAHQKFDETGNRFIVFNQTVLSKVDDNDRAEAKFAGSFKTKPEAQKFMENSNMNPWLYEIKCKDSDIINLDDYIEEGDDESEELIGYEEE